MSMRRPKAALALVIAALLLPLAVGGCVGSKASGGAAAGGDDSAHGHAAHGKIAILPGADDGTWFAFLDEDGGLWGYKDKSGAVRIAPRFYSDWDDFGVPKLDHIMAVPENMDADGEAYYLTKAGRIVGRDSLYMFHGDNTGLYYDCESEGFIRFTHLRAGESRIGMFDRNGNVAIPAEYVGLGKVTNGMMRAHRLFDGGGGVHILLIDTLNNVLIEDFVSHDRYIDYFSVEKAEAPHPDTARRVSFPAKGGGFYSFIDYEKTFAHWLRNELLAGLTQEKLLAAMLDSVTCYLKLNEADDEGCDCGDGDDDDCGDCIGTGAEWKSGKGELAAAYFDVFKKDLMEVLDPKFGREISYATDYAPELLPSDPEYAKYYDNCGQGRERGVSEKAFWVGRASGRPKDSAGSVRKYDYRFMWTDGGYRLSYISTEGDPLFLTTHSSANSAVFVALGNLYFDKKEYDGAAALYLEALKKNPADTVALHNLGYARIQKGDLAGAVADFSRLAELAPNNFSAYHQRSIAHYIAGDLAKSIADSERAMRIDSLKGNANAADSYMGLAIAYAAIGDYKKAEADYIKALSIKESALTLFNYGMLCAYMGNEAKADSLSKNAEQKRRRGISEYYDGDISEYTSMLKNHPKNATFHYHRGVVYARMGEYAKAAEDLKAALKINPKLALARGWLETVDKRMKGGDGKK